MNAVAADSTAANPTEIAEGGVGGTGTSRWKRDPDCDPLLDGRCQFGTADRLIGDYQYRVHRDPLDSAPVPRAHHDTPMVNIGHLLRHSAMCFPERPAITWRGATLDYRAFDARAAAFAEWLASVGAAPGERVVLYLDNCPDLLVAMFGTYRAGSTVLPSNSRLTEQELAFLVDDGEAKVIVTDGAHADVAQAAPPATPAWSSPATSSTRCSTAGPRASPWPTSTPTTRRGSSTRRAPPAGPKGRCCRTRCSAS